MSKLQVKKANFLVPLEESVSKPAQLLASYLVASLPKTKLDSDDLPRLSFPYSELRRAINADGRERVNKVSDVMNLGAELQKCILFYEDNVTERTVSWLIEQERNKKTNIFSYTLHPGLRKYLVNIEKHFTKYNYLFRVCLNAHAMKIYEILKMHHYRGEVVLDIEEDLKKSLGLDGKYPKIYEFKRRVLDVAQKELRQYTDIRFEYEVEEKRGKTPISFRFNIYDNQPTDLPPALLDKFKAEGGLPSAPALPVGSATADRKAIYDSEVYTSLRGWGGKDIAIAGLINEYGTEAVNYQIKHLKRLLKEKKKIDNPFAWFNKALAGKYTDTVQEAMFRKKTIVKKQRQRSDEKLKFETALKNLKAEYRKKQRAACDKLLKSNPELLDKAIEAVRETPFIASALRKGETAQSIYEDVRTTWSVQLKIQELMPATFEKIHRKYRTEIKEGEGRLKFL